MRREGYEKQELLSFIQETTSKSNEKSMELLKNKKHKNALRLSNETVKLLIEFECKELAKLQSLTYNIIAYIYKDGKDYQNALKALIRATNVCLQYDQKENLAVTYINISNIMRKFNKHKAGFDNAIKAAFQCQEDLLELKLNGDNSKISTKVVHLAMAFHYMGVHEENLGNIKTAIEWYSKACATMESNNGTDPEIRLKLYNKLRAAMNKKDASLNKTMDLALASPLKRKEMFKPNEGRLEVLSKSKKLYKAKKRSLNNERAKPLMLSISTHKESIDKITKDMLVAELKYNLRKDYGEAKVSPKINSLMMVNKYYSKSLKEEGKEEVEDLKRLGFGNWNDSKLTGRSIVIYNKNYVPIKKANTNKISNDKAATKSQTMEFLDMDKDKDQYEVLYEEIYRTEEAKDDLVLVILRGSKKNKVADLRLIQLNPRKEIFALKEEIDNKATLELNVMKEAWKEVKIKSKGIIAEDAEKYFKRLKRHNKDDDLLVYGLNNMLQNKETEKEHEEEFKVEEVQTEEAASNLSSKREMKEVEVSQPEDDVQEDNYNKEENHNKQDDQIIESATIQTGQYEDEDHMKTKKEESHMSEDEDAADNRAEEFDKDIQREVERLLGGKTEDNKVEDESNEEYNEASENIDEDYEVDI